MSAELEKRSEMRVIKRPVAAAARIAVDRLAAGIVGGSRLPCCADAGRAVFSMLFSNAADRVHV